MGVRGGEKAGQRRCSARPLLFSDNGLFAHWFVMHWLAKNRAEKNK